MDQGATPEQLSDQLLAELHAGVAASVAYASRFSGKLYFVLLDDKTHGSTRAGRSLWALTQPLGYRPGQASEHGDAGSITIPQGFVTDLASIPRLFWALLPPDGPWTKAAVVHDFLYYTKGTGVWKGHARTIDRKDDYSRAEADAILREAMADRGVDLIRRNLIYWAVRLGGHGGWGS